MSYYIEARDRDLYEAYRRAWANGAKTHDQAIEIARNSPPRQLYVSEYYIYKIILAKRRGIPFQNKKHHKVRHELYTHIVEEYERLKDKPMFNVMYISEIINYIVSRPPKAFYLSQYTATRIIRNFRRKHGMPIKDTTPKRLRQQEDTKSDDDEQT